MILPILVNPQYLFAIGDSVANGNMKMVASLLIYSIVAAIAMNWKIIARFTGKLYKSDKLEYFMLTRWPYFLLTFGLLDIARHIV
jgi:hypothetical protein